MIIIPTNSSFPNYKFSIELSGTVYFFKFLWNERASRWFMSILDFEENPIQMGIELVTGVDFLSLVTSADLPSGELRLISQLEDNTLEAGRDDLGENFFLAYEAS